MYHLVPSIQGAERPVAVWRGPRRAWPALLAHLRRARRRHGCAPHSLVTVRRSPSGEVFAVFVGPPPSDRLTPTAAGPAAAQLFQALEAVELCPDYPARWCPVRYSPELWVEEEREPAWTVRQGAEAMELEAMRRAFARHGCELLDRAGRFLVLAHGDVEAAYEEMAHGPAWLRWLPWRLLGGASAFEFFADEQWDYWCSGDLPRGLPPLPTADRRTVCDRIDAIIPGHGRRVWHERPDHEAREILRGLAYWRARCPGVAALPDEAALAQYPSAAPEPPAAAPPAPPAAPPAPPTAPPAAPPDPPPAPPPAADLLPPDNARAPDSLAAEAIRLAERAGGRWAEFVRRAIDGRDPATLDSYLRRLRSMPPPGREAG